MKLWLRLVVAALALVEAGYMTIDDTRALVVGDYITPRSGRFAGQLGPWSAVVSAVGIPPRSTIMKGSFAAYGVGWLAVIVAYLVGARWAWRAMILAAVFSLWYLPLGTLFSLVVIELLLVQRRQRHA